MTDYPKAEARTGGRLSVRLGLEGMALVRQAAEREGLQVASFIIMLLVRLHILPDSYMTAIKRRPVAHFNALHGLLGVVNKIGGNCKQLATALPDTEGIEKTQNSLLRASVFLTDALQGVLVPERVNLYRLQEAITKEGFRFNVIVKSVNSGRPDLTDIQATFAAIRHAADAITTALSGNPVEDHDSLLEMALSEMRANMKK
jgi:hypothetical protein